MNKAIEELYNTAKSCIAFHSQKKSTSSPLPEIKDGVFDNLDKPVSDHFTVGFGKATVMPPHPIPGEKQYYVAGYRINNPAVGILDDLTAKAIWIDDNSGRGSVLFISVDCVGLFSSDVKRIKNRLHAFCDITGCRSVNICATHCHAGVDTMGMWGPLPKSGRDEEFMQIVFDGAVDAAKRAYEDRRDGQFYLGYAKMDKDAQDAPRPPHVYSDAITRLRFTPDDGSREVYMVNFASHPESLQGKNSMISADFPCYASKYVKENKNAEMMYFPGAIGGIRMNSMDEDNVKSTIKTGERLGELVCGIKRDKKLPPLINILKQEMYLTCENPVFWAASIAKIIPAKIRSTGTGSLNIGLKSEMTYIEFGSLNILLIPGELFPELAYGGYLSKEESSINASPDINPEPLVDIAGDKKLLISGLANDEVGYILTPNDYMLDESMPFIDQPRDKFDRKHYPETNSLGPRTAYDIAKTFKKMMETVNKSK